MQPWYRCPRCPDANALYSERTGQDGETHLNDAASHKAAYSWSGTLLQGASVGPTCALPLFAAMLNKGNAANKGNPNGASKVSAKGKCALAVRA